MRVDLSQQLICLQPGRLTSLSAGRGHRIQVTQGRVWLTTPDRAGDHILAAGDCFDIPGDGKLLIEAGEASTIRIDAPATPAVARARKALARLLPALH